MNCGLARAQTPEVRAGGAIGLGNRGWSAAEPNRAKADNRSAGWQHIVLRFAAGQRSFIPAPERFNPMNFHLLADALQGLVVARHRAAFDDVTDPGRLHYRFRQTNFVDAGETLHAGGDTAVSDTRGAAQSPSANDKICRRQTEEPCWVRSAEVLVDF
jgi:hypothetical protein